MEERISEEYSDKGSSVFDQRSCQPPNSFVVPQMNLLQNNTSNNPTLLVSEILEQNSLSQNNIGLNLGSDTMNKSHVTSSLLPPPINHNRPWRSNSLTPPTPRNSDDCQMSQCDMMSNFGVWNGTPNPNYKLRSHSLTVLKNGQIRDDAHDVSAPLCYNCGLQPYVTNSSNEDQTDELIRNLPNGSGMRGLKIYLKKLRLHKYCATFLKYTYEEFINLDDETLKRDGVTLGARGKIMKSLEKIHKRPDRLQELLETIEDIDKEPDMLIKLLNILNELEEIVLMPLKPHAHKITAGRSSGDEKSKNCFNIPQMIYKLLEKIFIFTMLGHGSDEVNQILYGLLHNALKQECFNETQKLSMRSWIDKLGKVYDNVVHPKSYDKRRSFRGDGGNCGRRLNVRSGSISSNNHGLHPTHDTFCQKRHSYAFQDDKMQAPSSTIVLHPTRQNNQDTYIPSINRARSSSGLYQASNLIGAVGDCSNRRESSMSNDSGFFIDSRRTSEADYFSSLGGLGCNSSLLTPSSLDWGHQQPLITLQNYTNRKNHDHPSGGTQADNSSASISDFLSMQEPIARRDSGMSTNSESSRRSSYFSASPVPPSLVLGSGNPQKSTMTVPISSNVPSQVALGVCSASSGCSESSTDSLLEQDLQNLAVSVSQKGLE